MNVYFVAKEKWFPTETIVKVACGCGHTAAVTSTGKLLTWYVP